MLNIRYTLLSVLPRRTAADPNERANPMMSVRRKRRALVAPGRFRYLYSLDRPSPAPSAWPGRAIGMMRRCFRSPYDLLSCGETPLPFAPCGKRSHDGPAADSLDCNGIRFRR